MTMPSGEKDFSHVNNYLEIIKTFLDEVRTVVDTMNISDGIQNHSKEHFLSAYPFGNSSDISAQSLNVAKAEILLPTFRNVLDLVHYGVINSSNEDLINFLGPGEKWIGGVKEIFCQLPEKGYFKPFYDDLKKIIHHLDEEATERGLSQEIILKQWKDKWDAERKPKDPIGQYL
jgi:hypothetical protein